jgi:tRNA pseudouridine38-40 synthase
VRWAVCVEYDGSAYNGWQTQPHAPSVQAAVEHALASVAGHPVRVVCAGRTDTGVHAFGQVVHFDTPADRPARAWLFGGNSALPKDVSLRWALPVPDEFHARYGAVRRDYEYLIHNHPTRSALFARRATNIHGPLDHEAMHRAAQSLVGRHDFSAFRAAACPAKSPVREVQTLDVTRSGDFLRIAITANAFLHHMVRNIAGSLIRVGLGQETEGWIARVLAGLDRRQAGATAPPWGLYFCRAYYDPAYALPWEDTQAVSRIVGAGAQSGTSKGC